MAENESVKQSANLLRTIIRSIDKKLEYSLVDPTQEGKFSLSLQPGAGKVWCPFAPTIYVEP